MRKLSDFETTQLWYLYGCLSRSKEALMQAKNILLSVPSDEGTEVTAACQFIVEKHQEDVEANEESLELFMNEVDLDITALLEGLYEQKN